MSRCVDFGPLQPLGSEVENWLSVVAELEINLQGNPRSAWPSGCSYAGGPLRVRADGPSPTSFRCRKTRAKTHPPMARTRARQVQADTQLQATRPDLEVESTLVIGTHRELP